VKEAFDQFIFEYDC